MGETKPNKNRRTLGIKAKLLLAFGVAAIVPSLALGTTMTILTRSNVTEGIKDDISSNISLQAQALSARISAEDDTLSLIADSLGNNKKLVDNLLLLLDDDSSNDADAIDLVDEAINGKNNSTSDTTGSIIKTFNYAVTSDDNLEAARLYSKAVSYSMSKCLYPIYDSDAYLTSALSAVSENKGAVHWSYEDGSLYAYHSVCCFSDQSLPVVGMIRFQISLSNFLALFDNSYSGNGYILADSSGNIIGSRSVDDESIDNYALSMLSKGDGAYEGENSFGAVASNDVTGWKIVYYIDGKSVQSQFTQGTVLTLSITAAAFIVALIFAYFLGNGIANRILKMKNAADQVAIGNYDIEVDDRGNDEIGSLAEAFNLMSNEVKKTLQDMVITQDGISQTFAEILEAKSGQSGHHVKRVSEYVGILAEEIGFKEDEIHDAKVAAMLHDVGKIVVPNSILDKPGRLTDEEFEVMRQHVKYGEDLLKNSPGRIMQWAAIIAGDHHERWDGKGYLKHLKGDEIPVVAQISSVADVFDALVSRRSYKPSWSFEDAYNEIVKCSGTQFSPKAVEAFQKRFDDMVAIAKKYPDGHQES